MLYLHCGWPRTSTSSLQAALSAHRSSLADAGILFPEKWWVTTGLGENHGGLVGLLDDTPEAGEAREDFKRYLVAHSEDDVLLSAETLTEPLFFRDRHDGLGRLLDAAQEAMPTRCIWTLRRIDELAISLARRPKAVRADSPPLPLSDDVGKRERLEDLFAGMTHMERVAGVEAVYLEYASVGAHNMELMSVVGIPQRIQASIGMELNDTPRVNARLSRKQMAVLVNLAELSRKTGVELDEGTVRNAIHQGALVFEGDRIFELKDHDARVALHERALKAARSQGFEPYLRYFADDAIPEGDAAFAVTTDILTDDDLARLVDSVLGRTQAHAADP
jgi:uncharacterized protein (DUF1778 family)